MISVNTHRAIPWEQKPWSPRAENHIDFFRKYCPVLDSTLAAVSAVKRDFVAPEIYDLTNFRDQVNACLENDPFALSQEPFPSPFEFRERMVKELGSLAENHFNIFKNVIVPMHQDTLSHGVSKTIFPLVHYDLVKKGHAKVYSKEAMRKIWLKIAENTPGAARTPLLQSLDRFYFNDHELFKYWISRIKNRDVSIKNLIYTVLSSDTTEFMNMLRKIKIVATILSQTNAIDEALELCRNHDFRPVEKWVIFLSLISAYKMSKMDTSTLILEYKAFTEDNLGLASYLIKDCDDITLAIIEFCQELDVMTPHKLEAFFSKIINFPIIIPGKFGWIFHEIARHPNGEGLILHTLDRFKNSSQYEDLCQQAAEELGEAGNKKLAIQIALRITDAESQKQALLWAL